MSLSNTVIKMNDYNHGPATPIEIDDPDTFDWCSTCDHSTERFQHMHCNINDCDYFRCMIADKGGNYPQSDN